MNFEVDAPVAIAWLTSLERSGGVFSRSLWPATCGAPDIFSVAIRATDSCYRVRVIGEGGLVSEEEGACVPFGTGLPPSSAQSDSGAEQDIADSSAGAGEDARPAASAGCALVQGERDELSLVGTLFALAGLGTMRRRARSSRAGQT